MGYGAVPLDLFTFCGWQSDLPTNHAVTINTSLSLYHSFFGTLLKKHYIFPDDITA